eukprot:gene14196-20166_t
MGDLESCRLSEVEWNGDGQEKFIFDNDDVCIVACAGELTVVSYGRNETAESYGRNEVLGVFRTENMHPTLLSAVCQEGMVTAGPGATPEMRPVMACFAYLIDLQTVRITDMVTKTNEERTTLLNMCSYVQWVPQTDVVVAQSRQNLCVWYSINNPDRVSMFPIKGELTDIERNGDRTEVIVDEGINTVSYALDEQLIEALTHIRFASAMGEQNFAAAVRVLEPLELAPETEAQWMELSELALQQGQVVIAERCYAALGDVARTRFLHRIVKMAQRAELEQPGSNGFEHPSVLAQLAVLNKQWAAAESILLQHGRVDEALVMYQEAHRWEDAIRVAVSARHPDADALKTRYYRWLLDTGGLPARAAAVVMQNKGSNDPAVVEDILQSLARANLYERQGELYEHLGRSRDALDAYRRGHAYRRAIDLARREFQGAVIQIEEEWGDWLMVQKQMDAAINHFIEAGKWEAAQKVARGYLTDAEMRGFYRKKAREFEATNKFKEAEKEFVMAINM